MTGTIFDIKEFSLHDGPGSRVTVFLKGCPLRCLWCHNPEGLSREKQLIHKQNLCTNCNTCYTNCEHDDCKPFGRCVHVCPNGCLEIAGIDYTAEEISKKLLSYKSVLNALGGGITFSGGEPLMQSKFLFDTLEILKGKLHIAVETCAYTDEETFKKLLCLTDHVIMDIKLADREKHKEYTGVYNDSILNNFNILKNSGIQYVIRVPLIPGYTDTEENLKGISKIIGDSPCELLSYNPLAGVKYSQINKSFILESREANKVNINLFSNAKIRKL